MADGAFVGLLAGPPAGYATSGPGGILRCALLLDAPTDPPGVDVSVHDLCRSLPISAIIIGGIHKGLLCRNRTKRGPFVASPRKAGTIRKSLRRSASPPPPSRVFRTGLAYRVETTLFDVATRHSTQRRLAGCPLRDLTTPRLPANFGLPAARLNDGVEVNVFREAGDRDVRPDPETAESLARLV